MSVGDYRPVQVRADLDTREFIRYSGPAMNIQNGIFLGDGGRAIDLAQYTLLAKVAATQKWSSFVNEAAEDGLAIPQGIYIGPTIAAADIASADIPNLPVLRADAWFDETMLVIENTKTLETIIANGTIDKRTIRDHLLALGLVPILTRTDSGGEN